MPKKKVQGPKPKLDESGGTKHTFKPKNIFEKLRY